MRSIWCWKLKKFVINQYDVDKVKKSTMLKCLACIHLGQFDLDSWSMIVIKEICNDVVTVNMIIQLQFKCQFSKNLILIFFFKN